MAPASESSASRAPLDENDLEEDVDSEPAEIEGEAAEDGDPGDTGAELDDDQHWSDSPSDADRELHLLRPAEGEAEPELRVSEDEEKLPASPKHQERGPSQATSPIRSPRESALLFTPVHSPSTEGPQLPPVPAATQEKSPEERHFPEPLLSKEKPKADAPSDLKAPLREDVRKSFVESVEEIPFADDVEDTYDDKTEDSSLQEKFFTPPSCWPRPEKPPHPPLAKENGRLPALEGTLQPHKRGLPLVSAEAKELAEERMRAREKSVKSQALRDAMARQLSRMQQMELASGAPRPRKASSAPSQGKERRPDSPTRPTLKGSDEPTLKHEATSEEVLSPPSDSGGPDGSFTSSEGSSGKSKKRSSLFSPRRNKKEKKSKGEGRPPEKPSPNLLEEAAAKPKSLWKSVFSGYKKDKKKKADDKSCPSTPSSGATVDSGKHRALPVVRAELQLRRQLSFSEDSDLSSDDVLEKSSQKSRREPRTYTEEELNAKLTRRVQKAARRQAKQEELKRLHRAQIIQRQLQQVEERQRRLEERGVAVEKALRGEADYWGESYYSDLIDLHLGEQRADLPAAHMCSRGRSELAFAAWGRFNFL
ncbi:MICAL3 isoform 6 [Pongo abelii]|uniref:MICAL3 isoform 6 n=1 Tax=Pongo abelii TaxID=9601 RepID=A0A2J8RJ79_PONAB|nr:MICAL3 isoform 6 [Pongo abelii]